MAIGPLPGVPAGEPPLEVQLPHPGCFLVQKLLIADTRDPETERPKDLAYVYQVVQLFARDLPYLAETVRTIMEATRDASPASGGRLLPRKRVGMIRVIPTAVAGLHGLGAAWR